MACRLYGTFVLPKPIMAIWYSRYREEEMSWHITRFFIMMSSQWTTSRITNPLCGESTGNPPHPQRPIMWCFHIFSDVILNKLLKKQSSYRWFVTSWRPCLVNAELCLYPWFDIGGFIDGSYFIQWTQKVFYHFNNKIESFNNVIDSFMFSLIIIHNRH